jgi:hypothetical protein
MPDALEERYRSDSTSLLSMSKKALSLLEDKSKIFLMIEAGQIDWASHQNDAGLLLYEMLRFESVLDYLLEYISNHIMIRVFLFLVIMKQVGFHSVIGSTTGILFEKGLALFQTVQTSI